MTTDRGGSRTDIPFRWFDFRAKPWDRADLEAVRDHVADGGLVAYPTETVYGFGCGLQPGPLRRLSELKERDEETPFLLLVPENGIVEVLRWPDYARRLAGTFWPGALTLILADPEVRFPPPVRGGGGGVAVRRTSHPLARELVELVGAPLTSTSANPAGGLPARTAADAAHAALEAGAGKEMWILDGGALPESPPSTLVDCTGSAPVVVRPGAVSEERIACARAGDK